MEDQGLSKFYKRKVESADGGTRKNTGKTSNEDKKPKGISTSWSVQYRSKSGHNHHGHKGERNSAAGPMKLKANNEIKSSKQMDVKRATLMTNLASTYYNKLMTKAPVPYCMSQNQPTRATYMQKFKFKERVYKARGHDKRAAAPPEKAEDKLCYVVKHVAKNREKLKEDDDSNLTSHDTPEEMCSTDVDIPSLQNELSYSKERTKSNTNNNKSKFKKISKDNLNNLSKYPEAKKQSVEKSCSVSYLKDRDVFKINLRHQQCCTDVKRLHESGTNPSSTLIASLFETTKTKNHKSAIPIKCVKSTNRCISDSLQKIKFILEEVKELSDEINMFAGSSTDHRDYVYMDEVMMRNLIKLDNLDTNNNETVRTKRKEAIQFIQSSMNRLQRKLIENQTNIDLDEMSISTANDSSFDTVNRRKIRSAIKISDSR